MQRVVRLNDLVPGEPLGVSIVGRKEDAWTVYDQQTIGQVWLVRTTSTDAAPESSKVAAFSAVCPHLACVVGLDREKNWFHCPCHEAAFDLRGNKVPVGELGHPNPSPRGLDPLPCRLVKDDADGSWWVEVTYLRFRTGTKTRIPQTT